MKTTELAALLFVDLWLQYVTKVAPFPASVNIQYEKIQKIKKPQKMTSHRRKLFPDDMKIEEIPQTDDAGIHYDHIQKRHAVSKFKWDSLQKTEVIPPINNKFFPEYGVILSAINVIGGLSLKGAIPGPWLFDVRPQEIISLCHSGHP